MHMNIYSAYYEKGVGYWLALRDAGSVFFIDENGISRYIGLLNGGDKKFSNDIGKVYASEKKVYFFSRVSYELWILDKDSYELNHLKYYDSGKNENLMISNVDIVGDEAWVFLNRFTNPIVILSLNEELGVSTMQWGAPENLGESSITRTDVYDNKISFMNRCENEINYFEIDCNKHTLCHKKIEGLAYVNCCTHDNKYIYYLGINKEYKSCIGIIEKDSWHLNETNVMSEICLPKSIYIRYFRMLKHDNCLYLISSENNELVELNLSNEVIRKIISDSKCDKKSEPGKPLLNDIQMLEDKFLIYSPILGKIQQYFWGQDVMRDLEIDIEESSYIDSIKDLGRNSGILTESDQIGLDEFLKAI